MSFVEERLAGPPFAPRVAGSARGRGLRSALLGCTALLGMLPPATASAGNDGDVVAGIDAALTGGAVVANVDTGAAIWFNPAGVVRLDDRAIGLTGAIYTVEVLRAPGLLQLETGERTGENQVAYSSLPRAATFVGALSEDLKVGLGLFYSRDEGVYRQDGVASAGATPVVEAYGVGRSDRSLYHVSGTVGYRVRPDVLVGAALDLVAATVQTSREISSAYAGGAQGLSSYALSRSQAGGGLQLRAGVQWQPHARVRLGAAVATPTYLVFLDDESTETRSEAPPGGTPSQSTTVVSEFGGAWAGVETGSVRGGVALLGAWGFLELDVVGWLPLSAPEVGIDRRGVANVRLGGVFRVGERLELGAGVFTDPSPERRPTTLGDTQIDHYGFTLGMNFENRAPGPRTDETGFYLALALALRYSHGVGRIGGLLFPASYDPAGVSVTTVDAIVDEVGANLAIKAMF